VVRWDEFDDSRFSGWVEMLRLLETGGATTVAPEPPLTALGELPLSFVERTTEAAAHWGEPRNTQD
jgi:hypothetical protein